EGGRALARRQLADPPRVGHAAEAADHLSALRGLDHEGTGPDGGAAPCAGPAARPSTMGTAATPPARTVRRLMPSEDGVVAMGILSFSRVVRAAPRQRR